MTAAPIRHGENAVEISFIVITKNEEPRIARCLESVVKASQSFSSTEIVLVDSRSTDATVEIAKQFPVSIYVLSPSQPCSPAAGFYLGTHYSKGTYLVYLGGDMVLNARWIHLAVEFMNRNEEFAVLSGRLLEPATTDDVESSILPDPLSDKDSAPEKLNVANYRRYFGPALIRRKSLEQSGGWNPYLTGDEEEELSYRLRTKGFRIGNTSEVMAVHLNPTDLTFRETLRRFALGYSKGQGKVLKASFRQGRKAFLHHLWRLKLYIACDVWLAFGMALIVLLFLLPWEMFAWLGIAWLFLVLIGVIVLAAQHGVNDIGQRIFSYILLGIGIIQGLLQRLPETEEFPKDAIRVK